jgi:hypothetical protein
VIKKEMVRVPLASLLLRRLGSAFVERFDRHQGRRGHPPRLEARGRRPVARVLSGRHLRYDTARWAGSSAARSRPPSGRTCRWWRRRFTAPATLLPSGGIMVYRRPLRFEILEVLDAEDARERSRELIAAAVGEPLAP